MVVDRGVMFLFICKLLYSYVLKWCGFLDVLKDKVWFVFERNCKKDFC